VTEPPTTTVLRDVNWIDDAAGLNALVARLRSVSRFAFDTESNSMHAYRESVCLLQISLPDGEDAVIDPLAVDPAPLADALADPAITKLMHGADYDVLCLQRQYGMVIRNLFDTNIAARVLQWDSRGLGALLQEHFGVTANKKMQRFDWGRRPLPREAIEYARHDTHWLMALADLQAEQLDAEPARRDVFDHTCVRQAAVLPRVIPSGPDPWRIKGFAKLPVVVRARAAGLVSLREQLAEALDKPLFKVIPDDVIVSLSRDPPADRAALADLRRLHPRVRRAEAGRVLEALAAGEADGPPPKPPAEPRPPAEVTARFDTLRGWRKEAAESRGLEPDLIVAKATLWAIAVADPREEADLAAIAELDAWERAQYGAELVAYLERARTKVKPEDPPPSP
jgi:ribonuclease D